MSQNSRFDNMPQEQKDRILESQVNWAPKISFLFGPVIVGLTILFLSLIYWGAFNLFKGAALRFGAGFAITVYAFVPALISSVLAIVILLIKPKGDVDPEHFLASSPPIFPIHRRNGLIRWGNPSNYFGFGRLS